MIKQITQCCTYSTFLLKNSIKSDVESPLDYVNAVHLNKTEDVCPRLFIFSLKQAIIINMLRQTTNSKKLFYKGITLKDYLRKSAALFVENDREQTLLVDQFNQPLVNIEDLTFGLQKASRYTKLDTKQLSTKISTAKSIDQDQQFPQSSIQKPIPNIKIRNIYSPKRSNLSLKGHKQMKMNQLALPELSKRKNSSNESSKEQQVMRRRQNCLATRQVNTESQDEGEIFKTEKQGSMSNRQYVERIKQEIEQRRHLSLKKGQKQLKNVRMYYARKTSLPQLDI